MDEEYKDIPGYEGMYQVSNKGNVRSIDRVVITSLGRRRKEKGKILKPVKDTDGYNVVSLCGGQSNRKLVKVHRLVLLVFKGKPNDINLVCRHKDGSKDNNIIENLEWTTQLTNQRDRFTHGTAGIGEKNGRSKISDKTRQAIIKCVKKRGDIRCIAKALGMHERSISNIIKNNRR